MANIPAADLNDYQSDVLWTDTASNPKLPASPVPALSKALKTTQKRPIKAVNELYDAVQQNNSTVANMSSSMNKVMGNVTGNVQLLADLNKIGPDAISAIIVLYKMMAGPDLNNPVSIEDFAGSIHEAINLLKQESAKPKNDGSFLLNM